MAGFNGTIFAYGQTGSGKTFTMQVLLSNLPNVSLLNDHLQGPETDDQRLAGIIPRITHNMFNNMMQAPECMEFLCRASLVEIYCEKIRDLFNRKHACFFISVDDVQTSKKNNDFSLSHFLLFPDANPLLRHRY